MDARFQVSFTPLDGVLFAFPSRYLSTIGHHGVVSLGEWSPRIRTGFHVSRPTWDPCRAGRVFGYGAFTPSGRTFQSVRLTSPVPCPGPATPEGKPSGLGSDAFARRYLRPLVLISLPPGTEMFHFPGCRAAGTIEFIPVQCPMKDTGFPHSEICGSMDIDSSPQLIAVCRVLLRLMMPRHPSCARIRLAEVFNLASRLRCFLSFQTQMSKSIPPKGGCGIPVFPVPEGKRNNIEAFHHRRASPRGCSLERR